MPWSRQATSPQLDQESSLCLATCSSADGLCKAWSSSCARGGDGRLEQRQGWKAGWASGSARSCPLPVSRLEWVSPRLGTLWTRGACTVAGEGGDLLLESCDFRGSPAPFPSSDPHSSLRTGGVLLEATRSGRAAWLGVDQRAALAGRPWSWSLRGPELSWGPSAHPRVRLPDRISCQRGLWPAAPGCSVRRSVFFLPEVSPGLA